MSPSPPKRHAASDLLESGYGIDDILDDPRLLTRVQRNLGLKNDGQSHTRNDAEHFLFQLYTSSGS
jgi:hypothetical protein